MSQQQSHIYVIAFDSGTLKVGRAADGASRLATHRREAGRHGVGVVSEWCSPPCGGRAAEFYEQKLIAFCANRGALRAGAEYFGGLDFAEVRRFAEDLVGGAYPLSPENEGARSAIETPGTLDKSGFLIDGAPLKTPRLSDVLPPAGTQVGRLTVQAKQGFEPDRVTEKLCTRMPTTDETILLDLPPGEPVVEVLHVTRAADGQVVAFGRRVHAASRFVWQYEFDIPD